ncbi:hypothetical protein AB4369_01910 [Vibrio sp. 10N.261.49.A5]|uniref:Uncharacterized protein n=1 Tax=Vibrio tasmaniensis 1F-267 TaxID=1191324 RepID=A0ABX3B3P6_9VIBR|nr:hypothetical protein [Vibrio tasmaniensis]OEF44044.1 hypothetical protein A163_11530 [Vibrio tasmaniensis 1F-267]
MKLFDLKVSTINRAIEPLIDDDKLKLKLFSVINELNRLLESRDDKYRSMRKAYIRELLEDKLKTDRELRLIVLRLRTEARKELLKAIEREQDGLWIYYLLMVELPMATSQRNTLAH